MSYATGYISFLPNFVVAYTPRIEWINYFLLFYLIFGIIFSKNIFFLLVPKNTTLVYINATLFQINTCTLPQPNHVIQKPCSALCLQAYITLLLQEYCGCCFLLICFVQYLSFFLRQYATIVDRQRTAIFPLSLHFSGVLTL